MTIRKFASAGSHMRFSASISRKERICPRRNCCLATTCTQACSKACSRIALLHARAALATLVSENEDQNAGIKIITAVLAEPQTQIVRNEGVEPWVVLQRVQGGTGNFGYNAVSGEYGEYGDMVQMGVLDPCKVTRSALQNAASVAGLALTADCMIARLPDKKPPVMSDAAVEA